jgi:hypothetical protein
MNWKGSPVPPSRLQVLVQDQPALRAYASPAGRRPPRSLAGSFEDYLRASLRPVTRWEDVRDFLRLCLYAKDHEVHGREEVWIHPEDFERIRAGDCEDHALWAWVQFARLGWDVRFTAGLMGDGGHGWVTVYREEEVLVCETTAKRRAPFLFVPGERPRYEPLWSVDRDCRFFWHAPS